MRIIIVGCGKVGQSIAYKLSAEGHDIAVIDTKAKVVDDITSELDIMGVVGNGASYSVQTEAGIEDTDLLIAATDSDELNLLSCLIARKAGKCNTIARVRDPVYGREINYIKEELGLSMIVNPELSAGREISRLIRFPSAIKIDTFARGRAEMLQFGVPSGSILENCSLKDIPSKVKGDVLICAIQRGQEVIIPNGHTVIQKGDTLSMVAAANHARDFLSQIGVQIKKARNIMILGGGRTAYYVANELLATPGFSVKIIDKDLVRCEELSEHFPNATIIHGDATQREILDEEGIENCDAVVSLTGIDEENIFLSLYAQDRNPSAKIITKTDRNLVELLAGKFDLGSMIHPKAITAEGVVRFVRAKQNSIGSNVETLYSIVEGKAEALEFVIHEDAPVIGVPLMNLQLKDSVLVCGIIRDGKVMLPNGQSELRVGDNVIIVTTHRGFKDIKDILAKEN